MSFVKSGFLNFPETQTQIFSISMQLYRNHDVKHHFFLFLKATLLCYSQLPVSIEQLIVAQVNPDSVVKDEVSKVFFSHDSDLINRLIPIYQSLLKNSKGDFVTLDEILYLQIIKTNKTFFDQALRMTYPGKTQFSEPEFLAVFTETYKLRKEHINKEKELSKRRRATYSALIQDLQEIEETNEKTECVIGQLELKMENLLGATKEITERMEEHNKCKEEMYGVEKQLRQVKEDISAESKEVESASMILAKFGHQ